MDDLSVTVTTCTLPSVHVYVHCVLLINEAVIKAARVEMRDDSMATAGCSFLYRHKTQLHTYIQPHEQTQSIDTVRVCPLQNEL